MKMRMINPASAAKPGTILFAAQPGEGSQSLPCAPQARGE